MCKARTEKYHTLFQRKGGKWRRHGKDKNHIFPCLENSSDDVRIQFVCQRKECQTRCYRQAVRCVMAGMYMRVSTARDRMRET